MSTSQAVLLARSPRVWAGLVILLSCAVVYVLLMYPTLGYCKALREFSPADGANIKVNCAELFLYRYQTLMGAIVAVCAALLAAWKVNQQIVVADRTMQVMQRQLLMEYLDRLEQRFVAIREARSAIIGCGNCARKLHLAIDNASLLQFSEAHAIERECVTFRDQARLRTESLVLPIAELERLWNVLREVIELEGAAEMLVMKIEHEKPTAQVWNGEIAAERERVKAEGERLRIELNRFADILSPVASVLSEKVQSTRAQIDAFL